MKDSYKENGEMNMLRKVLSVLLCALIFSSVFTIYPATTAEAEILLTREWVRRYNSPNNVRDWAHELVVDSNGNVYVTGTCNGMGTEKDYLTIKYDKNGNKLWEARYNGPSNESDSAHDIALDESAGRIYVTGQSSGIDGLPGHKYSDYATVAYDLDGNELWVARYDGNDKKSDYALDIAVDKLGNVYVTGVTRNQGKDNFATIKYDKMGNEQWVAIYHRGGACSYGEGGHLAIDSNGNIYVTGYGHVYGYYDCITVAYDTNGNELWSDMYNGPGKKDDMGFAIAVDIFDNIYVTGQCNYLMSNYGTGDCLTIKYDSSGNRLWEAIYNGPNNSYDRAEDIVVDKSSGNVYITGWCDFDKLSSDYVTIAYDTDGNELWVAMYNGPGNGYNRANAITLDSIGNIYVTGRSSQRKESGLAYDSLDYYTIAYDSNGNELWGVKYNGPGNSRDCPEDIFVDSKGNVYVTGESQNSDIAWESGDFATIKYSQRGYIIQSTIDIDPDTLNLKSKGRWITAYITLSEGYDVNDINISSILLNDTIPAEWGDVQNDTLMIKFDRSDVEDFIGSPKENVELVVTGEFFNGTEFAGSDIIRVIEPP